MESIYVIDWEASSWSGHRSEKCISFCPQMYKHWNTHTHTVCFSGKVKKKKNYRLFVIVDVS